MCVAFGVSSRVKTPSDGILFVILLPAVDAQVSASMKGYWLPVNQSTILFSYSPTITLQFTSNVPVGTSFSFEIKGPAVNQLASAPSATSQGLLWTNLFVLSLSKFNMSIPTIGNATTPVAIAFTDFASIPNSATDQTFVVDIRTDTGLFFRASSRPCSAQPFTIDPCIRLYPSSNSAVRMYAAIISLSISVYL